MFLPGFGTSPPAGGRTRPGEYIATGRGYRGRLLDAGGAQTVRTGPAHAEKGLGGKSRAIAGKLPSAAKAAGRAPHERGGE